MTVPKQGAGGRGALTDPGPSLGTKAVGIHTNMLVLNNIPGHNDTYLFVYFL